MCIKLFKWLGIGLLCYPLFLLLTFADQGGFSKGGSVGKWFWLCILIADLIGCSLLFLFTDFDVIHKIQSRRIDLLLWRETANLKAGLENFSVDDSALDLCRYLMPDDFLKSFNVEVEKEVDEYYEVTQMAIKGFEAAAAVANKSKSKAKR